MRVAHVPTAPPGSLIYELVKSGISGDSLFVAGTNSIHSDLGIPPVELEIKPN